MLYSKGASLPDRSAAIVASTPEPSQTQQSQRCTQYHHLAITLVFPEVKHLYFLIIYFYNKWTYSYFALRVGMRWIPGGRISILD